MYKYYDLYIILSLLCSLNLECNNTQSEGIDYISSHSFQDYTQKYIPNAQSPLKIFLPVSYCDACIQETIDYMEHIEKELQFSPDVILVGARTIELEKQIKTRFPQFNVFFDTRSVFKRYPEGGEKPALFWIKSGDELLRVQISLGKIEKSFEACNLLIHKINNIDA